MASGYDESSVYNDAQHRTRCNKIMADAQRVSSMSDIINLGIKKTMNEQVQSLKAKLGKMNEGVIIKKCKREIEDSHSKVKVYQQFFDMFDIANPAVLEDQIRQLNNITQK
jgi:hypothetical protein